MYLRLAKHPLVSFCGSTLYVRLVCTAPPKNTNFGLTFLLTQLQYYAVLRIKGDHVQRIHELFLVKVAKGMLIQTGHSSEDLENSDGHRVSDPVEVPPSFRLTGRHFLEELPPCDSGRLRQCVCCVCSKKKEERKLHHDITANPARWHCAQPPALNC